jgi:hypothetical protein
MLKITSYLLTVIIMNKIKIYTIFGMFKMYYIFIKLV